MSGCSTPLCTSTQPSLSRSLWVMRSALVFAIPQRFSSSLALIATQCHANSKVRRSNYSSTWCWLHSQHASSSLHTAPPPSAMHRAACTIWTPERI
eukprot:1476076-Rhodomonas_salina.1